MRELHFELAGDSSLESLAYKEKFGFSDDDINIKREGVKATVRFNSDIVPVGDMLSYTLSQVKVGDISVSDSDIEEIIRRLYKQGV